MFYIYTFLTGDLQKETNDGQSEWFLPEVEIGCTEQVARIINGRDYKISTREFYTKKRFATDKKYLKILETFYFFLETLIQPNIQCINKSFHFTRTDL